MPTVPALRSTAQASAVALGRSASTTRSSNASCRLTIQYSVGLRDAHRVALAVSRLRQSRDAAFAQQIDPAACGRSQRHDQGHVGVHETRSDG